MNIIVYSVAYHRISAVQFSLVNKWSVITYCVSFQFFASDYCPLLYTTVLSFCKIQIIFFYTLLCIVIPETIGVNDMLGVMHHRRLNKNWIFGHPPPLSVWKTPHSLVDGRPDRIAQKRPNRKIFCAPGDRGRGGGCLRSLKRKIFADVLFRWRRSLKILTPPPDFTLKAV